MGFTLDFERPVYDLENQINDLKEKNGLTQLDFTEEICNLETKKDKMLHSIYENLNQWERVQLARHPLRPQTSDYINYLLTDFHEIAGDRYFSNDEALISGFGFLGEEKVCLLGVEKGKKTQDKLKRNFGMARPEGYRKALRVMKLASQFNVPIITLVDTPGAYPGIGAEERGQAQAIAENLAEMFDLSVPIISVIIGEGGSGGALGIAVADKVLMMEYSVYSVISPESCASILWSDPKMGENAAMALKLGPHKAAELGVIDQIIKEPLGGAHRNHQVSSSNVRKSLEKELKYLKSLSKSELANHRMTKFRKMGNSTLENIS